MSSSTLVKLRIDLAKTDEKALLQNTKMQILLDSVGKSLNEQSQLQHLDKCLKWRN